MYTKNSVVEPEPDSFAGAGAGAGEKETAPACCYVIKGFWGGRVAAIIIILVKL